MADKPYISIVTPVYNGMPQIRRTLDSLQQQTVPFEHLVMDACSTDVTGATVLEYKSRYNVNLVSEPDQGHFDALSKGFARTKGDVLAWLNAGDAYLPFTLALVERVFALYPEVDWITGVPAYHFEDSNIVCMTALVPVYSQTAVRLGWHNGRWLPFLQQESMFWRRSLWEKSGAAELLRGQGRGKGYAMDYHLWRRFAQHARPRTVCSLLASFAFTKGQISEKFRKQYYLECGVANPPARPSGFTYGLWALYSFLNMSATIKARHLK